MKTIRTLPMSFLLLILVSCGGISGTGGTVDETIDLTEKKSKTVKGKISSIDDESATITVNGVVFSHNAANIRRREMGLDKSSLKLGQFVKAKGIDSNNDGVYEAEEVKIDELVAGPIGSIDLQNRVIVILSQKIYFGRSTRFEGKHYSMLEVGDFCAVFGYRLSDAVVEPTLVEFLKEEYVVGQDSVNMEGVVSSINRDSHVVVINGVEVQLNDREIAKLNVGDFVELEDFRFDPFLPSGSLTTESRPDGSSSNIQSDQDQSTDDFGFEGEGDVVLDGVVENLEADGQFSISGVKAKLNAELLSSVFSKLFNETKVILFGEFNDKGVLIVSELTIQEEDSFELQGLLFPTDQKGVYQILGQKIRINDLTVIEFNLKEIPNAIVFVNGFVDENGEKIASHIYVAEEEKHFLEGKVETKSDGSIMVSGVLVQLSQNIILNDKEVSRDEVLKSLMVGTLVSINGDYLENNKFIAKEIFVRNLLSSENQTGVESEQNNSNLGEEK